MRSETQVNEAAFRQALSRFATGITVVTTGLADGSMRGITVNAFASVSLDPPLVLYCLGKSAFHFDAFANAESFAVNILAEEQGGLSNRFAGEGADDASDLSLGEMVTGSPILPGCLAVLDCTTEQRHDAGDHLIVVGRVQALETRADGEPLLYFRSRYGALTRSSDG